LLVTCESQPQCSCSTGDASINPAAAEVRRSERKGEKNDVYMAQALDFPEQAHSKMRKK
jgi:hypothetical protein